jgi:hypothetical protein
MPPENPSTVADQLSMVYPTRHADQARQIIQEAGRRFPELKFEEIPVDGANPGAPSGAAVMLLFDRDYAQNQTAMQWLTNWNTVRGWIPILPVALDPQSLIPPAPLDGIKSRVWPQDKDQLLTTTGACLGMAIRPGRSKLFISYRKADAFEAAKQLSACMANTGYDVFLDEADDRFDVPNLEIGEDVQATIAEKLQAANLMILLDSPLAPQSKWMRVEIEIAGGKPIPIMPIVLHTDDRAPNTRFRVVADLHRRISVRTTDSGGQLSFSDSQLGEIAASIENYLLHLYVCRSVQPRRLAKVFEQNAWKFDRHSKKRDLYDAGTGTSLQPAVRMLACCSFEDPVFVPSVRAFLHDIGELAADSESFARHLYLYPGNVLYPADLDYMQRQEVPELKKANTELIHYDEAVARINKLVGGFNAIFSQ